MKKIAAVVCFCVTMLSNSAQAQPIVIDWQEVGGTNVFERQAVTFAPVQVESFDSFQSNGKFINLVNTQHSNLKAVIYLLIGEDWELFAENDSIRGGYQSIFSLDSFVFLPVDFSKGALSGINITNTGAGATMFSGMTENGTGTQFVFSTTPTPVPEPTTSFLFAIGLLFLAKFGVLQNNKS